MLTLDYHSGALSEFNIINIKVLESPKFDGYQMMHAIKFKLQDDISGVLVFHATLIDSILDYELSNDIQVLPNSMKRSILEEARIRVSKDFPYLEGVVINNNLYEYEDYIDSMGDTIELINTLAISLVYKNITYSCYLLISHKRLKRFYLDLLSLPTRNHVDAVLIPLKFKIDICAVRLRFTRDEFKHIKPETVILLDYPEPNPHIEVRTPTNSWSGSLSLDGKITLEGVINMSDSNHSSQGRVPVELSVNISQLLVTIDELQKFTKGYVIDSGQAKNKAYPILANGVRVGSCNLVEIEGNIGFEIVSIDQQYQLAPTSPT